MIVRRCAQDHDVVIHKNTKPEMIKTFQLSDGSMSSLTYPSAAKDYFLWVDGEIIKRSDSFQTCEEEFVKEYAMGLQVPSMSYLKPMAALNPLRKKENVKVREKWIKELKKRRK